MALFDCVKKKNVQEPFTETTFECKRGNLTIRGTEYRPEGEDLPVAIVSHGFMAWQDTVRHYGVTCPVLIVHGTADKIVHPDCARRAKEAYQTATDVRLHMIEGGGHSFSKKHDVIAMGYLRDFARR